MASQISRRKLLGGLAAASLLSGCDSRPVTAFLNGMLRVNEHFERFLFSPARLARVLARFFLEWVLRPGESGAFSRRACQVRVPGACRDFRIPGIQQWPKRRPCFS